MFNFKLKTINKMKRLLYILPLSILLSCGGGEKENKMQNSEKKSEKVEVKKEKEVVEIKVAAMGESMAEISFDPTSISVPANSKVKLTFENKSSTEGMLHNFVLVELGSGKEIATAGIEAGKEQEFIPEDGRVLANTKVTNMGETVTIEFDAPAKGSYHYICTYPGHTNMIGRFNVI